MPMMRSAGLPKSISIKKGCRLSVVGCRWMQRSLHLIHQIPNILSTVQNSANSLQYGSILFLVIRGELSEQIPVDFFSHGDKLLARLLELRSGLLNLLQRHFQLEP